jgi:hypothetical protein
MKLYLADKSFYRLIIVSGIILFLPSFGIAADPSVLNSSTTASDPVSESVEKNLRQIEAVQKKYFGPVRAPKTAAEWKELDRAGRQGPEACYRWLQVFSEETLARTMRGKTWKDFGESDGVLACRKEAHKAAELEHRRIMADNISNLGVLRSALAVYYGDHEGVYPEFLEQLVTKYIGAIPKIPLMEHPGAESKIQNLAAPTPTDVGGWGYVGDPKSVNNGQLIINCNHPYRGKPLYEY